MQGSSENRESSNQSKFEARGRGFFVGRMGQAFVPSQHISTFLTLEFACDDRTDSEVASLAVKQQCH